MCTQNRAPEIEQEGGQHAEKIDGRVISSRGFGQSMWKEKTIPKNQWQIDDFVPQDQPDDQKQKKGFWSTVRSGLSPPSLGDKKEKGKMAAVGSVSYKHDKHQTQRVGRSSSNTILPRAWWGGPARKLARWLDFYMLCTLKRDRRYKIREVWIREVFSSHWCIACWNRIRHTWIVLGIRPLSWLNGPTIAYVEIWGKVLFKC